jgi:hypothetical protein
MSLRCKNCGHSVFNDVKLLVSPVPSLLGTNACPTSAESVAVRSMLLDTEAELLAFDHDIDLLEAVLEQRRQGRQALQKFRDTHATLFSPINRLPAELLTEIFHLLTWEASDVSVVAAVCNRWRILALSTPQLWSTIHVDLDKEHSHSQADMVRTWLRRSAMCSLSVTLQHDDEDDSDSPHPVIDVVVPYSHRLEYFSIYIFKNVIHALSPLKGQLPILQSLRLYVPNFTELEDSLYDIFLDAPQLRILDTNVHVPSRAIGYPFAQLTQCCIRGVYSSECLQVLRIARNITTCTFTELRDDSVINHHLPVVSHHLHTLSIEFAIHDPGKLFLSLWLPAVREITIGLWGNVPWPHTEFLSLVSHSSRQLEKLVLQTTPNMSSEQLICCLEAIPSLQDLRFGEGKNWSSPSHLVNDAVLRKLTHQPGLEGQLPLVPSLHTFRYVGNNTFEDQSLLDMIESRWGRELPKGLGRLRAVFVSLSRDFASETLARAKAWNEQGLDIVLQTSHS